MEVSEHAIDEYINDNKSCTRENARKKLLKIQKNYLKGVKYGYLKCWTDYTYNNPRKIIRHNNRVIVFNKDSIITYYKTLTESIDKYLKMNSNKIKKIL